MSILIDQAVMAFKGGANTAKVLLSIANDSTRNDALAHLNWQWTELSRLCDEAEKIIRKPLSGGKESHG